MERERERTRERGGGSLPFGLAGLVSRDRQTVIIKGILRDFGNDALYLLPQSQLNLWIPFLCLCVSFRHPSYWMQRHKHGSISSSDSGEVDEGPQKS